MSAMSEDAKAEGVPERLVRATVTLLAEEGPAAIKARTVAAATGLSTMVVYSHFGGIPELIRAVVDHGFDELTQAFAAVPASEDPVRQVMLPMGVTLMTGLGDDADRAASSHEAAIRWLDSRVPA